MDESHSSRSGALALVHRLLQSSGKLEGRPAQIFAAIYLDGKKAEQVQASLNLTPEQFGQAHAGVLRSLMSSVR